MAKNYGKGINYEIYIRRAFKCNRGSRNGADSTIMETLIDIEQGNSYVNHIRSKGKYYGKVQSYLVKATNKFLKMRLNDTEQVGLQQLLKGFETASSSDELLLLSREGINLTDRFKF